MKEFLMMIASAVVAYTIPKLLESIEGALTPARTDKLPLPWFQWLLACLIGGVLGGGISAVMGPQGQANFGNWAAFGACLGIMQWFALRSYLPVGGWWALASALGWGTYVIAGNNPIGWSIAGLMVGILQILGLKVTGKGWWIGGNLIAWTLVALIGLALWGPINNTFGPALGWLTAWGLAALIAGVVLLLPLSRLTPTAK